MMSAYSALDLANPLTWLFPALAHSCHAEYLITSTQRGRLALSPLFGGEWMCGLWLKRPAE